MVPRILIIEDNQANLDLMAYILSMRGYTILTAMDGEAGLHISHQELPDLIICDIQIPKIDGLEVIRRLKSQHNALSAIPIIAITAYAMVGDREKILSYGCNGYISKPIEPEKFASQVESFLPVEQRITSIQSPHKQIYDKAVTDKRHEYRGTVLIVDDSEADRDLSEMLLRSIHFRPLLAENVDQALALIAFETPDIILSDFHLPEKNGLDFFNILQTYPQYHPIPFIIISSSIPPEKRYQLRQASEVNDIIFRPIEPQKFIDLIEKIWTQASAEKIATN